MTQETVLELGAQTMWLVVRLAGPIVAAGVTIGVGVSILQAVTQIQEQSLTFVPKVAALMAVLIAAGGWMMSQAVDFTRTLIMTLPELTR